MMHLTCIIFVSCLYKLMSKQLASVSIGSELSLFNGTIPIGASISFQPEDKYFDYGREMTNGWNMFVEWQNDDHGVRIKSSNYSIFLNYIEDYSDASYVKTISNYFAETKGMKYMFSAYSDELTESCASEINGKEIVLMSSASSNTQLFQSHPNLFGTLPSDDAIISTVFSFLSTLNITQVAVLSDSTIPACNLSTIVSKLTPYDYSLYNYFLVDITDANYITALDDILLELRDQTVDTIYACSTQILCEDVVLEAKKVDYNPDVFMFGMCITKPEVIEAWGSDATYSFGVSPWAPTSKIEGHDPHWSAQDFFDLYVANYGIEPTYHAAGAFVSGSILTKSMELCQSLDFTDVVQTLETNSFSTFYGNLSFDTNHQPIFDLLVLQIEFDLSPKIVYPYKLADVALVYPTPTWSQQKCEADTNKCDGHGACDVSGVCICDEYFYKGTTGSCDLFCKGEVDVDANTCYATRKFYLGGMVDFQDSQAAEYIAHLKYGVSLINNKSDGWFDDTPQIYLEMQVNDSACDADIAYHALLSQIDWATSHEEITALDGLIGAMCSSASISVASHGQQYALPQISYYSTSSVLSNKDNYPLFARTCASDSAQGPALALVLNTLGITPFVSVIYTTDQYASVLADSFINSYVIAGNQVLYSYGYEYDADNNTNYDEIIDNLARYGSRATVLVLYSSEVIKLLHAASKHPTFGGSDVVWIAVDAWANTDFQSESGTVSGVIGVGPYVSNNDDINRYIALWQTLDPNEYPDADGDRTTVSGYGPYVVDAVFAMAQMLQQSIYGNTGLTDNLYRKYTYETLTTSVQFSGLSGIVDFDAQGDRLNPFYTVLNYQDGIGWISVGNSTSSVAHISYNDVVWPNGDRGKTNSYSTQFIPYCPAGQEPVTTSNGVYQCTACSVGYYMPYVGQQNCFKCPEGADCNDVGIIVPCILPEYWREQPPPDEVGDFHKYSVYKCEYQGNCEGGCNLNNTCSFHRIQSSPVCSICIDGYYDYSGSCQLCQFDGNLSKVISGIFICTVIIIIFGICFTILIYNNPHENFTAQRPDSSKLLRIRQTIGQLVGQDRLLQITSPSFVSKALRGSGMTIKLLIAFIQIMAGSFYKIDLNWPRYFKSFFSVANINVYRYANATYQCSQGKQSENSYYRGIITAFMSPIVFILILTTSFFTLYIKRKVCNKVNNEDNDGDKRNSSSTHINMSERETVLSPWNWNSFFEEEWVKSSWNLCAKIFLWFCLISYPSISASMLSIFNCRDLGVTGSFIRVNYSATCTSSAYDSHIVVGVLGLIFYVVGIPVLFYTIIANRNNPWLANPSKLLYNNFAPEWLYYEVYDLIRKLLLTSVVSFVSDGESSSSQCLYLLLVDLFALLLLAYSRPYANPNDDILSGVFISIECCAFLVALIIVSGISDDENFNNPALYTTIFVVMLFGIGCMVPSTLLMKFTYIRTKVTNFLAFVNDKLPIKLPDLSRLDSKFRHDEDIETMRRGSIGDGEPFKYPTNGIELISTKEIGNPLMHADRKSSSMTGDTDKL